MLHRKLPDPHGVFPLARVAVACALAVLCIGLMPGAVSARTLRPTRSGAPLAARGKGVATPHRVDLRAVLQPSPPQSRAVSKPFLTRDAAQVAAAKASPHGVAANRVAPVTRPAGFEGGTSAAGFAGPFPAVSHDFQLGNGLDGDIEPPDTQLAAGPQFLLELVNSTAEVLDKSGQGVAFTTNENLFDFAQLAHPGEVGTDPRVSFDQSSGRFFATELGFSVDANGNPRSGTVLAAVSVDANPLDGFLIYQIYSKTNALCDQPILGISGDKISVACNEFDNTSAFTDDFFFVLNKSDMLSGSALDFASFGLSTWFSLTPTLTLSPNGALPTPAIATYNRRLAGTPGQIGVVAVTGLPPATVTATEVDLGMTNTAVPPAGHQLGDMGGPGTIDTGDDRFLNSAWEGGNLWVSGDNSCVDTGTSTTVSCAKLVDVNTSAWDPNASTGAPTVGQDLSLISGGGFDIYYPAVTLNSGGDPYIEVSESSSSTPVSLGAFTIPQCGANFTSSVVQPFFFLQGNGRYVLGQRWGDYSGAAVEPNDPNKLWLTGEYTVGSGTRQWGTAAAEVPISTAVDGGRPYTGGSDAIGVGAGATDWFFAEGFTGGNFDEFLTVQNPGAAQRMCVDYLLQGGGVISRSYNLPASSRTTLRVNDEVPAGSSVSMHVHAANPIVAERPMYFDFNGWTGGNDVMGATSLGGTFYFAEGFTGGNFDQFLTLMNTDPSATSNVNVTYFFASGPPKVVAHPVGPHSRVTIFVNDPAEAGPNQNVSTLVQVASGPSILAERPMYFNFNGQWTGGHVAIGSRALSTHLDLAEGFAASNFDEFLTILNPNASPASVTITYNLASGGTPVVETTSVPANSRATRFVNSDLPAGTSASVHVDSSVGVVVERPMYFDFNTWTGGHDAVAVDSSSLGSTYDFAEGFVAGNFDEFLTVENNNATPVTINITYFLAGGGTQAVPAVTIPAHSRYTRFVNSDFGGGVAQSVQVTSTGGSVLVERPMYFAF